MAGKTGGKNRKFGRHARNASSKMQAQRSMRNKQRNIEKAGKKACIPATYPVIKAPEPVEKMMFTGLVPEFRLTKINELGEREVIKLPRFVRSEAFPLQIIDVIRA